MPFKNFTGSSDGNSGAGSSGGNSGGGSGNSSGGSGGMSSAMGAPPFVKGDFDPMSMLTDYNERFKNAGPTLFRDEIVQQVIAILIGKNKPNCILAGPAGVGKTRIVENIAWRIANKDPLIPPQLQKCKIYELPLSNIVAGSGVVGDLESKAKAIVDFAADPANNAVIFIDEIHNLVGGKGINSTYKQIAEILKPALARGEFKCIGATTTQEYKKLAREPALNRRFSRVIVDEFTNEQTIEILKNLRSPFMTHYSNKVVLTDDILETVVRLANEYHDAGNHRPDSAITLLDRACGEAIVQRKVQEENAKNDPLLRQLLASQPVIALSTKQIKRTALKMITGNAKKSDFEADETSKALKAVIKGQDAAIDEVVAELRRRDMDLFPKKRPLTMLFAGGSGVGKTELTKLVSHQLTGEDPIILNMTEYHSPASINRIIGSPAGYVGSDSNQELPFDILESNPYKIVLLDEFEKADRSVQRLFMSAFDEGSIKTSRGDLVDFSRTIIIATTNAGHTNQAASIGFGTQSSNANSAKQATAKLKGNFDVELLNRFRRIIPFAFMTEDIYRDILQTQYQTEIARLAIEKPMLQFVPAIPDDRLNEIVTDTFVPEFGARHARDAVQKFIEEQV